MNTIKVLVATPEQKEALEGIYEEGYELRFVEDADGNWVVNDKVITNGHFLAISKQLLELPIIDYKPKFVNL